MSHLLGSQMQKHGKGRQRACDWHPFVSMYMYNDVLPVCTCARISLKLAPAASLELDTAASLELANAVSLQLATAVSLQVANAVSFQLATAVSLQLTTAFYLEISLQSLSNSPLQSPPSTRQCLLSPLTIAPSPQILLIVTY